MNPMVGSRESDLFRLVTGQEVIQDSVQFVIENGRRKIEKLQNGRFFTSFRLPNRSYRLEAYR
jgi:hypothetical protein